VLDHPFGLDVEAARRLSHRFAVKLLAFFAEQPVDEHLGRVGVRRALDDRQCAAAATGVRAFFHIGQSFDRQSGFNKRQKCIISETDGERDFALGQTVGQLALIAG